MKGSKKIIYLEHILNKITEEQILYYYFNTTLNTKVIKSPLREDKNPSLGINKYKNKIMYRDFATGESGTLYTLIGKLYNLSFNEVLVKIYKDIDLIKNSTIKEIEKNINQPKKSKSPCIIQDMSVSLRQWDKHDIEYWEQYGISLKYLKLSNTFPLMSIHMTKNKQTFNIPADKYAYVFFEYKDGVESFKIYQPYNSKYKWINKHNNSVWDLWDKLPPKGKYLIITSSRKDALCIWENTTIPAVSLQSEQYFPKKHVVNELITRFDNIFVLYDNDFDKEVNVGDKASSRLCDEFGLVKLTIPEHYQTKDTSDFCKKYGRKEVKNLIFNLIKNKQNEHKHN